MINVNVSVKSIVRAEKIKAGILADVFVRVLLTIQLLYVMKL